MPHVSAETERLVSEPWATLSSPAAPTFWNLNEPFKRSRLMFLKSLTERTAEMFFHESSTDVNPASRNLLTRAANRLLISWVAKAAWSTGPRLPLERRSLPV